MSIRKLEYAVCKWSDRTTAQYYFVNTLYEIDGKETKFDSFGRQLGEPNFNYPRPAAQEERNSETDTRYFRFTNSDNICIVYRETGYLQNTEEFTSAVNTLLSSAADLTSRVEVLENPPFVYGVIHDPAINTAASACQRVVLSGTQLVNVDSFAVLPAHDFRRCVMDDLATRHVNYYLDPDDSTKKADGTAADLTGADGDVMVEIPIVYWRVSTLNDGRIAYLVSDKMFTGATIHPFFYVGPGGTTARKQYVGAFQSTICNADGERLENMLNINASSSSNYSAGYKARSVAGCKPWTSMTQATHRTAAANNGAVGINSLFKQFLLMMMVIEGGSFDTQTVISQGFAYAKNWDYRYTRLSGRANFGNGSGSIMSDPTIDAQVCWQAIVVNGITLYRDASLDSGAYFGWKNGTHIYYTSSDTPANGSVACSDASGTDSGYTTASYSAVAENLRVVQFSYRGIENPYGEVWEFEDGIQKYQTVTEGVYSDLGYWWTADTSKYTDVDQQNAATPDYAHVDHAWPTSCYPKTLDPKTFFPLVGGGSTNAGLCDYFYNDAGTGARCVLRGGPVTDGARDGAGCVYVSNGLGIAYAYLGARLSA